MHAPARFAGVPPEIGAIASVGATALDKLAGRDGPRRHAPDGLALADAVDGVVEAQAIVGLRREAGGAHQRARVVGGYAADLRKGCAGEAVDLAGVAAIALERGAGDQHPRRPAVAVVGVPGRRQYCALVGHAQAPAVFTGRGPQAGEIGLSQRPRQRPHPGPARAREHRQRGEAAVDGHVPDHRPRQPAEQSPDRLRCFHVVGVVQTPVAAGKDLGRNPRVDHHRVHRHVRQIAADIAPAEAAAIGVAAHLVDMPGRGRGIGAEAGHGGIADGGRLRIGGHTEDRSVRQHRVAPGDIAPAGKAGTESESEPDIAIQGADHGHAPGGYGKTDGLDHRAIVAADDEIVLGQIRADWHPARAGGGAAGAVGAFPDPIGAGNQMIAALKIVAAAVDDAGVAVLVQIKGHQEALAIAALLAR